MIKHQTYQISNVLTLNRDVLTLFVNKFWDDVFLPLSNIGKVYHLLIICKVEFKDPSLGYKSLANMRKVNIDDKDLFIDYLSKRLGILSDSYSVSHVKSIIFTYIIREGLADGERRLLDDDIEIIDTTVTKHEFNNMQLPLTMDPNEYGEVLSIVNQSDGTTQYVVISQRENVFVINVSADKMVNNVKLEGHADLTWIDTKHESVLGLFKREIGKNVIYVENGKVIIKEKELPAKAIRKLNVEKIQTPIEKVMTIDIETVLVDNRQVPYLICGYSNDNFIFSFAQDLTKDAVNNMFKEFIDQILANKDIKFIYAHNLSGFDGIFLLEQLIEYGIQHSDKVKPLIFNGKLMSIEYKDKKNKRSLIFKDSFLLLPLSLRELCKAFDVLNPKTHFPFLLSDTSYIGNIPDFELWKDIKKDEFDIIAKDYLPLGNELWSFREESLKYCKIDCKSLFDVLEKFNSLVFNEFKLNVHNSLTLPALAMKIFRSQYMEKDTIYQILGNVERDIRQSYTGGAVDVFIPFNKIGKPVYKDGMEEALRDIDKPKFQKLFYYDVNSLYPFVMANLELPIGKPIAFDGDITIVNPDAYGFFYCKIISPHNLIHPFLQRRIKTPDGVRTISGLGEWEGWISSIEYNRAQALGYQISILKGYRFNKGIIFDGYVKKLYKLRMKYTKSHPMNLISKLLMNSLYGKFVMKSTQNKIEIYNRNNENDMATLNFHIANPMVENYQDIIDLDNFIITVTADTDNYKYDDKKDMFHGLDVNIAIASAVTAGGRTIMSEFKNSNKYNLYYSDTDSIVIDKQLPKKLVGSKLGQLKLESEIEKAVFLAPKVYAFVTTDGEEVIKVKGINKEVIKNEGFNFEMMRALLIRHSRFTFTQEKWFKKMYEGDISILEVSYNLKVTANKRELIYETYQTDLGPLDVFVNTRPYNYNNIA